MGKKLKKGWVVETGINYTQLNKTVTHSQPIPVNQLAEVATPNGVYESQVNFQVNTQNGDISTDLSLARNLNSTVASTEVLDLEMTYAHSKTYLDIPLLVGKEWQKGNWQVGLKTGLLNRFELTNTIQTPKFELNDERFTVLEGKLLPTKNGTAGLSTAAYLPYFIASLSLEYYLNPSLSLFLEPSFASSLQPLPKLRGQNIRNHNSIMNLGMRYHL